MTMTPTEMDAAVDAPIQAGCTTLWALIDRLMILAREPHPAVGTCGNLPVFIEGEQSVGAQFLDPMEVVHSSAEWMKEVSPLGFTLIG